MKSLKIWRSSRTEILVTEGHAPLDNCNKKFYYKMRLGYFSSTVPLQSHSRVHLDFFFFTEFYSHLCNIGLCSLNSCSLCSISFNTSRLCSICCKGFAWHPKISTNTHTYTLNMPSIVPSPWKTVSEEKKKKKKENAPSPWISLEGNSTFTACI